MLENRVRERNVGLQPSFQHWIRVHILTFGIRLCVVRLNQWKRKPIMLDDLWFWEKWLIDEYEKEACNLLAMNVARFTPIIKNLHGHNFQIFLAYCHSDWKFASDKTKLSEARQKLTELEKTRMPREGWFDCGGSRSSARVLRVWHSSLDYVPVHC